MAGLKGGITAATYPGAQSEAFAYDPAGNRTSHTDIDGTTTGYNVDATGQLISDTTGTTYSYDDAGNLPGTSDGDVYVYDDYGRATSITAGGVTETYTYDARDVRATVDGITQLWDRNVLPTLISTGAGDNYVHVDGVARDGNDWLLADAVGSVRATVDQTGVVSAETAFTAFGEPLTGQTDSFGFAGEQLDTTGLLHLRARQYNPTIGRFTTVDPVQPGAPGTTGYNLYTYAANNPTTFTDPTGQAVLTESALQRAESRRATLQQVAVGQQQARNFLFIENLIGLAGLAGALGGTTVQASLGASPTAGNQVLVPAPDNYEELAAFYLVSREDIENCVLNYRANPRACDGLPGGPLRVLLGEPFGGNFNSTTIGPNGITEVGFEANLDGNGTLRLFIRRGEETPSGRDMFAQAVEFFGVDGIERIQGRWSDADGLDTNLRQYRSGLQAGLSPAQAALNTFTGREAARHGFGNIPPDGITDNGSSVTVTFVK